MTTADDILRMTRRAREEADPIDRARLFRRAREEAALLSDEEFERVEDALRDDD